MDKRGISPIIATLLLISFAVAVGLVIMNFGRAQVELEAECPLDIGMQFVNIGGQPDICSDGSQIRFSVENGVNVQISGLIVNAIGTQSAQTAELPATIPKAGIYFGIVPFADSVRQVKITPKIVLQGEEQICVERALVMENLRPC